MKQNSVPVSADSSKISKLTRGIFFKYFSVTASILLFSFVFFSAILMVFNQIQWTNNKRALLLTNVEGIAQMLSDSHRTFTPGTYQLFATVNAVSHIIDAGIFVVDQNGMCIFITELACPGGIEVGDVLSPIIMESVLAGEFVESGTLGGAFYARNFVVGTPVINNGTAIGAVFACVPLHAGFAHLSDVFTIILLCAFFVLALSFVATYIASAQMTKPLRSMVSIVKNMEKGDFSQKVPASTIDEIATLGEAINKMSASVSTLEDVRRNFISNVSHELKTPMTTISGFVDGILDGTIPKESSQRYLEVVAGETKRLSRLVNSMLTLTRLDNDDIPLNKIDFNLTEMVIEVFVSFEHRIGAKHIEINGLDSAEPLTINTDRDFANQAVYNLVENAIKFTPNNGSITVSVTTPKDDSVLFSIENSGHGITEDQMAKLFERFYKTDSSRSEDKTGLGLGLHIVKSITSLLGGTITVSSIVGKYTKFELSLPKGTLSIEK